MLWLRSTRPSDVSVEALPDETWVDVGIVKALLDETRPGVEAPISPD